MGLVTWTFDLLNLKLVRESHLRWGTFFPDLGTLGLPVLELLLLLLLLSTFVKRWIARPQKR